MSNAEPTDHDWLQIEQAANGCYSGKLSEWPDLDEALKKCNAIGRLGRCTASVINLCQALWYKHQLAELEKPCVWTYDEIHDKWDTSCGNAFQFMDSGPNDNECKFCCYCGHPLTEQSEETNEPS